MKMRQIKNQITNLTSEGNKLTKFRLSNNKEVDGSELKSLHECMEKLNLITMQLEVLIKIQKNEGI